MKTYQVVLAKSYVVTVNAGTEEQAGRLAEFYTGDIKDISTNEEKQKLNFSINQIECKINESLEVKQV